jgi:hypothetical protein
VYKLRNLLDKANEINSNCDIKLIKSSQTLQIIQSRLAYKQQFYSEILLKNNQTKNIDIKKQDDESSSNINGAKSDSGSYRTVHSPLDSYNRRFSYLSDDDNESFVSADSVSFGNFIYRNFLL